MRYGLWQQKPKKLKLRPFRGDFFILFNFSSFFPSLTFFLISSFHISSSRFNFSEVPRIWTIFEFCHWKFIALIYLISWIPSTRMQQWQISKIVQIYRNLNISLNHHWDRIPIIWTDVCLMSRDFRIMWSRDFIKLWCVAMVPPNGQWCWSVK